MDQCSTSNGKKNVQGSTFNVGKRTSFDRLRTSRDAKTESKVQSLRAIVRERGNLANVDGIASHIEVPLTLLFKTLDF